MTQILIAYIVAVVLNRAFNFLWWWGRNFKTGPLAYYREHGLALAATALLHVPAFVVWYSGAALPVVNAILAAALKSVDAIPGVDLSSIELPTVVTPAVTLIYGWPFDSIVSRIGMVLGSKFALFTNGREGAK